MSAHNAHVFGIALRVYHIRCHNNICDPKNIVTFNIKTLIIMQILMSYCDIYFILI